MSHLKLAAPTDFDLPAPPVMALGGSAALQILVCWHRESTLGHELADFLYTEFARDPFQPESRGIGAPLFFHVLGEAEAPGDALRLDDALRTIIVLLVDDTLVGDDDADELLANLLRPCRGRAGTQIITVALSENARYLEELKREQHVRYHDWSSDQARRHLSLELAHAFSRYIGPDAPRPGESPPPIRVFLSHAKKDGTPIAEGLRLFLQRKTGLGDFFDVNDLAPGHSFEKGLEQGVSSAALVVIQTDAYGSREWCQKEVLWAKKHRRPIIVVNAVCARETRMFPYLGNVPSVRWKAGDPDAELDAAHAVTLEVFRTVFFEAQDWKGHFDESVTVLSRPPELVTLRPDSDEIVLYPDPPLADDELALLASYAPRTTFVTPISRRLKLREKTPDLRGKRIGLSVSESQDAARLGLSGVHLRDAVIELARHLLASGATLVYGGDLRDEGFTQRLFSLVRDHNAAGSDPFDRIENVLPWPDSEAVDAPLKAQHKPSARFIQVGLPDELLVDRESWTDEERAWRRAFALSLMRQRLAERCDARIVLGGRVKGYGGLYPGVAEEAFFTLKADRPLFVAGGFGGCAAELIGIREGAGDQLQMELLSPPAEVLLRRKSCAVSGAPLSSTVGASLVLDTLRTCGAINPLGAADASKLARSRNTAEIVELVLGGLALT